ncbi:MAG: ECF transporter S component [Halanaerobiales bacterium]
MKDIKRELREICFNNLSIRCLAYLALFTALVALATYFIKIPGANTSYYNLGEAFIFMIAIVFGPKAGLIAGALGSSLVDLVLAPIWVPFTFVIKGVEGWVVGKLAEGKELSGRIIAVIIGGHIMILGYAIAVWILYGWPAVLPEILGNYGQAAVGAIIALPLARTIEKIIK